MTRPSRRRFLARGACAAAGVGLGAWTVGARAQRTAHDAREFDYVIVGAGSAGCIVAHRLSAQADIRVLLLEAGGPGDDARIRTPGQWTSLLGSQWDWNYQTTEQPALAQRRIGWPRGKVYGGSSAINAMLYMRGHRDDFATWRDAAGAGWGFDEVLPYFKRSERNSRGASALHGAEGPMVVADGLDPTPAHHAFIEAARQLGYEGRADWDFNGLQQEGGAGFYQKHIHDGRRQSTADAFLVPILGRPNLVALPRTEVRRIVFERTRATGVEYLDRDGPVLVRARREVILCAGVVDTPRLLLRSGVGEGDALRRLGLGVVADVPAVGRNLQDHVKVTVVFRGRREVPGSTVSAGLFTRSKQVPSSAPADLQFYFWRGLDTPSPMLAITVALERPASRGTITLASADPSAPPRIDPGYIQERADLDALVDGVRLARELGRTKAFEDWRGDELEPGPSVTTSQDLAAFVARAADTIYHPAGSCAMGSGSSAVVDGQLRVRGVEGLRIADASVMPVIVNGNTNAATMMIGERAADLVLRGS